ncbi:MAG TPA: preprotein translocase subunit SecE [Solirubrobacteraceae bacterium]|nr:preprotein translocase subunit SecE [Solirubrobacteraceae bacterium]
MARDRKRAKQRRDRRGGPGARQTGRSHLTPSQPERADLPGALEHASSDVDEFDAALVRGAEGVTAAPDTDDATAAESDLEDGLAEPNGNAPEPTGLGAGSSDQDAGLQLDDAIAQSAGDGTVAGAIARPAAREQAPAAPRGGNRVLAFLEASWAELQRVQWPDRRQVVQATAVVLGFVIVAGVYLGVADLVAKEIVEFVL